MNKVKIYRVLQITFIIFTLIHITYLDFDNLQKNIENGVGLKVLSTLILAICFTIIAKAERKKSID